MTEETPAIATAPLKLHAYQTRLIEFLKRHNPDVWKWFAATKTQTDRREDVKFELLKSTYRIERESQPHIYETADEVARTLGLTVPTTIYQAQDPQGLNASLVYLPDEIHVVLHGPLAAQLSHVELRALFGHEFAHFLLWRSWNGDLRVAADMLAALTNDRHAHPAHFASLRLLTLYNEILCDRGALAVTQDMRAVISLVVKVQTGVQDINPDDYLRQAEEIFARGKVKAEGITHPEAYIRAQAVKLWADNDPHADAAITEMMETSTELRELDLLGQETLAGWTRRVIDVLLSRKWFQTDPAVAHARLYFDDYSPPSDPLININLSRDVHPETESTRDYFCYLLLDFVSADRDLDEPSLAAALTVAEELGIKDRFVELARRELRLRKNQLEKVDDKKAAILQEADQSAENAR